jgi:predicted metal-dependent hydrolase
MNFPFNPALPRHWNGGSPAKTHLVNGFNLFLPAAEKYMIAAVKSAMRQIQDPELAIQMRGFIGQEAQHAGQHERFFEVLRAQGYAFEAFTARLSAILNWALRKSMLFALAIAVVGEHYTAVICEHALLHGLFKETMEPVKSLLEWHSAEELEHKSVLHDAYVALGGSYWHRVAMLPLGYAIMFGTLFGGAFMLLRQDGMLWTRRTLTDGYSYVVSTGLFAALLRGTLAFLNPRFHPQHHNTDDLATLALERMGLEASVTK